MDPGREVVIAAQIVEPEVVPPYLHFDLIRPSGLEHQSELGEGV